MANETGATAIAALYAAEICSREVGEALNANTVIAPTVWHEQAVGTKVVKFGLLPVLSASGFTDTTGMSLTEYDPTSTSVTAAPVGLTVRVTGYASALTPEIISDVAGEIGTALAVKVDTDLAALFPSVTASVGTSGAAFTLAQYLSAVGKLNIAKVPAKDRVAILSAKQYQDILGNSQTVNSFAFTEAVKNGSIPSLYGVTPLMSQTTTTANSGADWVGCMFNRKAFGLGTLKDIGVRVQDAPAQYNATDIAGTIYYGVGLIDTTRAVKIVTGV